LILPLLLTAIASGEPDASLPPINDIENVRAQPSIFKAASRSKPLVIRSADAAAGHFSDDAVAALKRKLDFKQQFVLVFAWRGSGQDRLRYDVAESFPEQVSFRYKPGRTRDLRPHVYIFALRSNVTWRVR